MTAELKPAVTVVIPAYNAERTIAEAIRSVQEQSFQDVEIIIANDCSSDNTVERVLSLSDKRIKLLHTQRNAGCSRARNIAISNARGDWLSFLDADDQYGPQYLERLVEASRSDGVNFLVPKKMNAIPDRQGRLRPISRTGASFGATWIDACDFEIGLQREYASVNRAYIQAHGISFPEEGSGGDWMHLMATLLFSGACGYWLQDQRYFHRVTGRHYSSSLKAIREQHVVLTALTEDERLPNDIRMKIERCRSSVRRRLPIAALRERRWGELLRVATEAPADLAFLPGSAARFAFRKVSRMISLGQR
jgi:glycosyltransferase involved in cell wall biosynthesis